MTRTRKQPRAPLPALPTEDRISIRWLIDHVPLKFWSVAASVLVAFAVAGFTVAINLRPPCSLSEVDALRRQRDALRSELAELEVKKATMLAQVTRLEIDRQTAGMSDEQVGNEVKMWTRP